MRSGSREASLYRRRRDLRYLSGRVLYHQRRVCDTRGDHILGVYPTSGDEATSIAIEGLEISWWDWEWE